jgi:phasin family protein
MELMETIKQNASKLISSAADAETIAIDKLEKIASANVDSIRYYNDINIRQLRAMANIRDLDSLRQFVTGTISLTGEIATRMINDSQKSISIGTEIREAMLHNAQVNATQVNTASDRKPAGKRSAAEA